MRNMLTELSYFLALQNKLTHKQTSWTDPQNTPGLKKKTIQRFKLNQIKLKIKRNKLGFTRTTTSCEYSQCHNFLMIGRGRTETLRTHGQSVAGFT